MTAAQRTIFWSRTRRLTGVLLLAWAALTLLGPWFARDLNAFSLFGFPLGYWLASQGALLGYLVIILVYVVCMDRLEAALLDGSAGTAQDSAHETARRTGPETP